MDSTEIRRRFLAFFEKRGHAVIPSASLVAADESETDKTLFNTAGMQPLIPYLLGKEHPAGKRIVDVQKCVRTVDIDDVGDDRHLTFFEMMGNWSLGDYFKKEAISWSYEFLTSKEEGLGLDPNRLYVTIFEGNEDAPLDTESKEIWMSQGIPEHRIYPLGAEDNWWSPGENGPCGPDTEMFYDMTEAGLGDMSKAEFVQAVKDETVVEIWNDVFMEYEKKGGKVVGKLEKKNVDTGAGLERISAVMLGRGKTAYDTDLFRPLFDSPILAGSQLGIESKRIVADHIRAAVFLISDGVVPSNTYRGYILRRLLRRAIYKLDGKTPGISNLHGLVNVIAKTYEKSHPEIAQNLDNIRKIVEDEESRFMQTIEKGRSEFAKGTDPFILFTSYGFPFELTKELAAEKGMKIDEEEFKKKFEEHQNLSRAGAEQKFKGGLADTSEMSVKYHTATHLLHQALHDVLGEEVGQKGSNITPERLRFDFSFPRKMTDEEKKRVEDIVNEKVQAALPVNKVIMPKTEAEKTGARHFFGEKYPDEVSVYYIGDSLDSAYSKEFCGGPHVSNTSELGHFKIQKEEAVSAGVRRIKAILE